MTTPAVVDERVYATAHAQPPGSFTTVQLCQMTGLTFRQLDYWARTGVLRPSFASAGGSGTKRLYTAADIRKALILSRLLDVGVSLQRARKATSLLSDDDADLRWLVVGENTALCGDGELERVVRELGVCTIVDLREEAFKVPA